MSTPARYVVGQRREHQPDWWPWLVTDTTDNAAIIGRFRDARTAGIAASELNRLNRIRR